MFQEDYVTPAFYAQGHEQSVNRRRLQLACINTTPVAAPNFNSSLAPHYPFTPPPSAYDGRRSSCASAQWGTVAPPSSSAQSPSYCETPVHTNSLMEDITIDENDRMHMNFSTGLKPTLGAFEQTLHCDEKDFLAQSTFDYAAVPAAFSRGNLGTPISPQLWQNDPVNPASYQSWSLPVTSSVHCSSVSLSHSFSGSSFVSDFTDLTASSFMNATAPGVHTTLSPGTDAAFARFDDYSSDSCIQPGILSISTQTARPHHNDSGVWEDSQFSLEDSYSSDDLTSIDHDSQRSLITKVDDLDLKTESLPMVKTELPAHARTPSRRRTHTKKDRHRQKSRIIQGATWDMQYDDEKLALCTDGTLVSKQQGKVKYDCSHCSQSFDRAEHCKRHVQMHLGYRPFKCPVPHCKIKREYDSVGRFDNFGDHVSTHVRRGIVETGKLERLLERKVRGSFRNICTTPEQMKRFIQSSSSDDAGLFESINKKLAKHYDVHVDWNSPTCQLYRCEGEGKCTINHFDRKSQGISSIKSISRRRT